MPQIKEYMKLKGAVLNGTNIKRDGTPRAWSGCTCTGRVMFNFEGKKSIEVKDPTRSYETRWVKLPSFHGSVHYTGTMIYFDHGLSTRQIALDF